MLLTLAYDPGTSLTKAIYALDDGDPKLITMPPAAVQLDSDSRTGLEERCDLEQFAKPEDLAWFRFKKTKGKCFAVGNLAQSYVATQAIHALKYEASEYKVVGLLGAIAQREQLPEAFDLDLAVLLPLAEYRDGNKLRDKLLCDLKRFWWQGQQPMSVKLQRWKCYPEGSGKILAHLEQVGLEAFQSQQILLVMFGHRNVSLLWFVEGKLDESSESTDRLGFYQFLETIQQYVSGYTHEDFLNAIRPQEIEQSQGEGKHKQAQKVTRLSIDAYLMARRRVSDPNNIQAEQVELEKAIRLAQQEYLGRLRNWFDDHIKGHSWREVFFLGGTYQFFKDEIDNWIRWGQEPPPEDTLTGSLSQSLGLNQKQQQSIGGRLHDVFTLFDSFRGQ